MHIEGRIYLCRLAVLAVVVLTGTACPTAPSIESEDPLPIKRLTRVFGPYNLKAGGLMQMPAGDFNVSFPEPIWVVGYKTEIVGDEGQPLQKDLHCHTFLARRFTEEWVSGPDTAPFKGLFSDGNTTEFRLPEGFGFHYDAGEPLRFVPMFNNRQPEPITASMRVTVYFMADKELPRPLTPLYGVLRSVVIPHLYFVPPGESMRERQFNFSFEGKIHAMAVHIHPYGRSLELINQSRGETVWKAVGERNETGTLESMPIYANVDGYAIRSDETYRLRAIYDNPTDEDQDAMAGLVVLFSTEDGQMPRPPAL